MSSLQDPFPQALPGVMDNSVQLMQSTVADFISQITMYITSLCSQSVGQASVNNFKALICLQAQTLELQQLRMQLSNILSQSSSLVHANNCLQFACSEQDKTIMRLEEELRALRMRSEESETEYNQLQYDFDSLAVSLQDHQAEIEALSCDKADLELEVAQLKQTLHFQMEDCVQSHCVSVDNCSSDVDNTKSIVIGGSVLSATVAHSLPSPGMNAASSEVGHCVTFSNVLHV